MSLINIKTMLLLILSAVLLMQTVEAGKLSNFEKKATSKSSRKSSSSSSSDNDDDGSFLGNIVESIVSGIFSGGDNSSESAARRGEMKVDSLLSTNALPESTGVEVQGFDGASFYEERERFTPLAAIARFDTSYHAIESDVTSQDYFVELGFSMISINYHQSQFNEDDPDSTLDFYRTYAQLRLILTESIELDAALGLAILDGEESNLGGILGLRARFYPSNHFGAEASLFTSTINEVDTTEFDFGIYAGLKGAWITGGYRTIMTEGADLNGPYIGLSLRY